MKVLDVDLLQDGLTRNLNRMTRLEKEMTDILHSVEGLVALDDALKGEGGQAIRDFYQSCHVPFLHYFLAFTEDFHTVLEQTSQALTSLEPMDTGHIVEDFLEAEVEDGLTKSADITRELTDETNAIMYMVADIVSLPKLDDSRVQESVANAKRKRDATVEALHTFDRTQTNQLEPIESSIQSMKEWLENIDGLFKQGLTDVNFQTDQWSKIAGNSAIVLKLSAMGFETGIEAQESLTCERPVETKVESDRTWYQVVGDVLNGIVDGVVKAIVDIFEGLFDLLKSLFTDPIGFFGGVATAIMNPVDTFHTVWGAVETAWERDVINGNAHSRGEFFSYAVISVVGIKGLDKVVKVGKLGIAAAKVDKTIPYNAMQTDKLKDVVKTNVKVNMQQKAQQTTDLLKSNFTKEAMNKTIQATQNSQTIAKSRNTLEPSNINAASIKLYDDVVKAPIAKTQNWMKQKEQLLNAPIPNVGSIPLGPSTNTTVREGIESGKDSGMQIVENKDASSLSFINVGEYFNYINEIGKGRSLSNTKKFDLIQKAYDALEVKGDVTVVANMKFLKPEGFGPNGRMILDWPPKMGFDVDTVQPINKVNLLPESWDRIGGKGGENFTVLPERGNSYTYEERAIPYIENPQARHVGTFNNEIYYDAIDAVKSGNFEELNRIAEVNGKGPISYAEFLDFKAHYEDFQENATRVIDDTDATYGLKGKAAPWVNSSTGERLMEGGAEQIVTPLSAEMLEIIGVIPKY